MATGTFSENGFTVAADNALDLLIGTQAAGAGMISVNVQQLARSLNVDLTKVQNTIVSESGRVSAVNQQGFTVLNNTVKSELGDVERGVAKMDANLENVSEGIGELKAISAASVAIQAAGFALTIGQLVSLRGEVRAMHGELAEQGKQLIGLQKLTNSHLERLSDFAERTLETQERILETLVTSRTNEATQLIRQGWDNLQGGFDDDAFSRFVKSLEYDNTVYVPHAELAQLYERRQNDSQAEEHHRRAVRFAGNVGPEIKGYAHIQYAAFLERKHRLQECVLQIKEGLACIDPASEQQGSAETEAQWRFYLAEIFTKLEQPEDAFKELRKSIGLDARFFNAAMGSESFQRLQPTLTEFLVQIDSEQREAVITILQEASSPLPAIQVLDETRAVDLQQQGARMLEQLLLAKFDQMQPLHSEVRKMCAAINTALEQIPSEIVAQLKHELDVIEAKIKDTPPQDAPETFQTNSAKSIMRIAVTIGGVVGFAYPALFDPPDIEAEGIVGIALAYVVTVLAGVIVGGIVAAVIGAVLNQRSWMSNELPIHREKWTTDIASALDVFRKLKIAKIMALKKSQEKFNSPTFRIAIENIEAFQEPPVVTT
jgi:tetratricopeptide (TPR) repeat protein